jgi:nucleoside-diphosphate-sugar epimerase
LKALVTGAGGFLGGAIARALRDRGDEVRGFSRGEHPELAAQGIEQHQGDVVDREAVTAAARGVDIVFHVAAKVGAGGRAADYYATNVTGTENVIAACGKCGVPALVFTSTPSVVSGVTDLEGVDESVGYATHYEAEYGRTKAEAERLVLSSASDALRTVALRPPLIWGPNDTSLLPRVIERGRSGALRRIKGPPTLADITYIDDAVQAHLCAADRLLTGGDEARQISGRPYFVSSGDPVEIWDFLNGLLEAAGVDPVRKSISPRTALMAAWVFEKVHALSGAEGDPRMSRWMVRQLTTPRWFDIGAARRDLGYDPQVSLEDGMRRLKAWFDEKHRERGEQQREQDGEQQRRQEGMQQREQHGGKQRD